MQRQGEASAPAGEFVQTAEFDLADLWRIRRAVSALAMESGLPDSRAKELALAVNEIACNAIVHGRPPTRLRIWHGDGELICEVSDAGDGIKDGLAGQVRPAPDDVRGRGLWLSRQIADAVEITKGGGCTVSLRAATPN